MALQLTDVSIIKHLLGKHGVDPKRSLGQNFLVSPEVVEATVAILQEGPKNITELGSGLGTLTQALAMSGFHVRAVEKDDVFAEIIPTVIPPKLRPHVEVIHDDLKEVVWEWETGYQLVGNIPYNLSGLIIRRLTQLQPAPQAAVLLMQKEVGQRVTAEAPNMNLLSLSVGLWGHAESILSVPPNCFWPQPKVHSQLIFLLPKPTSGAGEAAQGVEERERILAFAKTFFQKKRKQIGGVLKREFKLSDDALASVLENVEVGPSARPEELSVQQWRRLYEHVIRKS